MASNWPTNGNPFAGYPYSGTPYTDDPMIGGEEEKQERHAAKPGGGLPIPGGILGGLIGWIIIACWLSYKILCLLVFLLRVIWRLVKRIHQ